MPIYGAVEVAWFQLTPMGADAMTNERRQRGLDPGTRMLLKEFARFGGTMEWDEIKLANPANAPTAAGVALRRLIDRGYVQPVKFGEE